MLGGKLQRIEHAQDLIEIATGAHRIAQLQLDLLIWAYHEHGANGSVIVWSSSLARVPTFSGQHAVELGDLKLRITNQRIVQFMPLCFFDIAYPLVVTGNRIRTQADNFAVTPSELRLKLGQVSQFRGTHWREVLRMRKQNGPSVADPVVKIHGARGGFGRKIGCRLIDKRYMRKFGCRCGTCHYSPSEHEFFAYSDMRFPASNSLIAACQNTPHLS